MKDLKVMIDLRKLDKLLTDQFVPADMERIDDLLQKSICEDQEQCLPLDHNYIRHGYKQDNQLFIFKDNMDVGVIQTTRRTNLLLFCTKCGHHKSIKVHNE